MTDVTRRGALTGLAASGAILGAAQSANASGTQNNTGRTQAGLNPPMSAPRPTKLRGLLLNKERARAKMEEAKVDLLICSKEQNFYYLTGHLAGAFLLGYDSGIEFATLSAYGDGKPTMITSQVSMYFQGTDKEQLELLNVELVGLPADFEAFAALTEPADIANAPGAPFIPRRNTINPESASERRRHDSLVRESSQIRASLEAALIKQVLDNPLPNLTIAVDDDRIRTMLERTGKDIKFVDGEALIRKIRIQKSPMELELMRYAAASNAASGRAAAMQVRNGATFDDLRSIFWQEAAKRHNTGHFMMIDTLMSRMSTGEIKEGRSFLIDCVSTYQGYHGDYGRTVCVGEPDRKMAPIIKGLSTTWDRLREELKLGMKFSEILALGNKLFKETNLDVGYALSPHTIGLHHSDDENIAGFGNYAKADIVLEENMVLSVDMPLLDSGLGGTAHLEDLVIMTKDGAELINDSSDRFIVA
ncbi:MAG: M24 family metallopeptidase [Erythrobacter sp.]